MRLLLLLTLVGSSFAWAQSPAPPALELPGGGDPIVAKYVVSGIRTRLVQPVYPTDAQAAGVAGVVRLRVMIAKDGTVKPLTVREGPALLQQATIDAVSQWTYEPYTLNGEPVEVLTEIVVNFRLQ